MAMALLIQDNTQTHDGSKESDEFGMENCKKRALPEESALFQLSVPITRGLAVWRFVLVFVLFLLVILGRFVIGWRRRRA